MRCQYIPQNNAVIRLEGMHRLPAQRRFTTVIHAEGGMKRGQVIKVSVISVQAHGTTLL